MPYSLGRKSKSELKGVHPRLLAVVERAIQITLQDFTVVDGLRTLKEQREYIARGVSKTLKSKHLPQEDGFSHAVDLVPYINGKLRWEMDPIYIIAHAMRQAGQELGVRIRWGACWQELTGTDMDPEMMVAEYIDKRRRQGRKPFVDGPHFEILS